jgi:hypothetical protein
MRVGRKMVWSQKFTRICKILLLFGALRVIIEKMP